VVGCCEYTCFQAFEAVQLRSLFFRILCCVTGCLLLKILRLHSFVKSCNGHPEMECSIAEEQRPVVNMFMNTCIP